MKYRKLRFFFGKGIGLTILLHKVKTVIFIDDESNNKTCKICIHISFFRIKLSQQCQLSFSVYF